MEIMIGNSYIFAGHSHVRAFPTGAWTSDQPMLSPLRHHDAAGLFSLLGNSPRDAAYWDALVEHASGRTVFLFWCGNQHLSKFLFAPRKPFDFVLASYPDLSLVKGAEIVPEELIRASMNEINKGLPELLNRLKAQPNCRTVVCGTPPPKGNDDLLMQFIHREGGFVKRAEQMGIELSKVPLTPLSIRWKLWVVIQELLAEAAESAGIEFIPSPLEARDERGFLKEEFWGKDATHANHAYGALFLRLLAPERIAA